MHPQRSGHPLRRRLALVFLAVLQAFVMVSVPVADAYLEAQSTRETHVESPDSACEFHHDHLVCTLCRLAGSGAAPIPPSPAPAAFPSVLLLRQNASHQGLIRSLEAAGALGPRAPPLA